MKTNQKWLLKSRPVGLFKDSDFEWREEPVPALKDGEILVRQVMMSLDPTNKVWATQDSYLPAVPLGEVMRSFGIATRFNRTGCSMTENEKCEWMEGGFYVVCHSDYKSSMGNGVGLSVLGYSTDDKAYTYREFNSFGEFDDSRGVLDGDTWTWTNDEKMGGMTMKGRFTMKMTSATSYNFTFDMSEDGTKWSTVMEGKASKK